MLATRSGFGGAAMVLKWREMGLASFMSKTDCGGKNCAQTTKSHNRKQIHYGLGFSMQLCLVSI